MAANSERRGEEIYADVTQGSMLYTYYQGISHGPRTYFTDNVGTTCLFLSAQCLNSKHHLSVHSYPQITTTYYSNLWALAHLLLLILLLMPCWPLFGVLLMSRRRTCADRVRAMIENEAGGELRPFE